MELVKIETLADGLNSNLAEDRGFNELKDNGYLDDMKKMYCCVMIGDDVCGYCDIVMKQVKSVEGVGMFLAQMAVWSKGRLYDSEDVVAFEIDGGIWAAYEEGKEWLC